MTNLYKLLFFNLMLTSTLIVISSFSWLSTWMGMEINLLAMIPLMKQYKNKFSSEAALKYFMVQTMASALFLFSIIMFSYMNNFSFYFMQMTPSLFISTSLLIKIGAAPFHFWLPEVSSGLNWNMVLILLTWQKIAPILLIFYTNKIPMFLTMIIILSSLIGSIQGINQTCFRKILSYSSINHISWMISSILNSINLWTYYFLIYSFINFNIIIIFMKYKIYQMNQLNKLFPFNKKIKLFFMLNFLSLGGLPPFTGFYPKWMIINNLILNNHISLSMFLVIFTLISLFFYLRITFSTFSLINSESIIWMTKNTQFSIFMFNFFMLFSLMICSILINWM